jgi:hypothetical protein
MVRTGHIPDILDRGQGLDKPRFTDSFHCAPGEGIFLHGLAVLRLALTRYGVRDFPGPKIRSWNIQPTILPKRR